jgi:hypothetical protein
MATQTNNEITLRNESSIKKYKFNLSQLPCFLYKKSFSHLWNSPDFYDFFHIEVYSLLKSTLKDDLVIANIGEFLLGDAEHWNWNINSRLNVLYEMNDKGKKLTYLKSNYIDKITLKTKSKWLIAYQNVYLIEWLKPTGFVQYEDEYICVLYLV